MLLHKSVVSDSRVRREASTLARAGHEVVVLELASVVEGTCLDGFARRSMLPPAWMRRRLPFHLYRAAFLAWFVAGIVRERPDVVHAHDAAMLLPGVLGARLTGARLVYDSHELATSVPYRERSWALFVAGIERLGLPRCAAVITVSDGIATHLRERYRLIRRPTVVRNVSALSPDGSSGLRKQLGIDAATPLVLHQGAPAPARGCEVLVEALASLPDDVHLVFLGDPERGYAQALRRAIARHNVQERVRLLPGVPLADLLAHTAEADVGVTLLQDTCLNHRLALPNKLFEYIAAGVPVLAADLPETRRLVEHHGVGWCVTSDDPIAVADALRVALHGPRDPALSARLASAAAELTWEREQQRLLELYTRLMSTKGYDRGHAPTPAPAPPSPTEISRTHAPAFPSPTASSASRAKDHQPVTAQRGQSHKRPVGASSAAGKRWEEGHGATADLHEIPAQPTAQLRHADQASVAVGSPHARLPDRNGTAGREHTTHLAQGAAHVGLRAHGG
jgi:glycosyltransferase involved in cell wall biosynthesis